MTSRKDIFRGNSIKIAFTYLPKFKDTFQNRDEHFSGPRNIIQYIQSNFSHFLLYFTLRHSNDQKQHTNQLWKTLPLTESFHIEFLDLTFYGWSQKVNIVQQKNFFMKIIMSFHMSTILFVCKDNLMK